LAIFCSSCAHLLRLRCIICMNNRRNSYFYVLFPQALDRLSPVTHSVANTLKRVLIIVATCVVFKTPISTLGMVGSGVAVLVSSL